MKWAIIFYAIFSFPNGDLQEHITWNLTFSNHLECKQFFDKNSVDIVQGLEKHLDQAYDVEAKVVEFGCARAVADFKQDTENRKAQLSLRLPLELGKSL